MAQVTVYGTAWCEVTRELRIYLTQNNVPFEFKNVENDASDEAAALTMNGGTYATPVVLVGERALRNPTLSVLERELLTHAVLERPA